jgi:ribosomal protein S18 acetylase RimI-like enzyme
MPMLQFWFCGVQSPNYVSLITATTRGRCKNGLRTKLSKTSTLGWLRRVIFASNSEVNGVGLVHREGEIRLCYVAPGNQGRGLGSAILTALEDKARTWGLHKLHLGSTLSARPFYERHGYTPGGQSTGGFGSSHCHPYEKTLHTNP